MVSRNRRPILRWAFIALLCSWLVTCTAWFVPIGPLGVVDSVMMRASDTYRDLRHADHCLDAGGCWDSERRGCVDVEIDGVRLEPTPRQNELGHCRTPLQDRLWGWLDPIAKQERQRQLPP
jgi:hypothetical protein